ncbi:hypothetical protein D3C72_1412890 [compost metagenome]
MVAGAARDAHAAVVQERAAATAGGEEFVARGVIDDRLRHLAALRQRDGHGVVGQAVDEVRRAVQGIDDPLEFSLVGTLQPEFLAQHGMVRVSGMQCLDDGLLGGAIDFRDIIARPLASHAESFQIHAGTVDNGAGTPGRLDGDVEHRVHKIPYVCGGFA